MNRTGHQPVPARYQLDAVVVALGAVPHRERNGNPVARRELNVEFVIGGQRTRHDDAPRSGRPHRRAGCALAGGRLLVDAVSSLTFKDPAVPIVANCTGKPMRKGAEVKQEIIRQIISCVQWKRSMGVPEAEAGVAT